MSVGQDSHTNLHKQLSLSWTGLAPLPSICPGVDADGKIHSLPQLNYEMATKQDVLAYFDNGWTMTEVLFSSLKSEEAFFTPPYHQLRHPLIFYYAHPAILYVNKLRVANLLDKPINSYFESLFETGVDEMSWDDMSKNEMTWPTLREVNDYRKEVYQIIRRLILECPLLDPQKQDFSQTSPAWALLMGFEHERIHLETSSVLIRETPLKFLRRPEAWPNLASHPSSSSPMPDLMLKPVSISAGAVQIGKPQEFSSFGWDNEYGHRTVEVAAFEVTPRLISNREFLDFVKSGGYRDSKYWSDDGWGWRSFRNAKHPAFWLPDGPVGLNQYRLRTLFEVIDFPEDWPAIVNFHEAKAYCNWKTEKTRSAIPWRLISEAEHHRLREPPDADTVWNCNLMFGSESSTTSFANPQGLYDVFGNCWQWCEDQFNPLDDFTVHPYYEDFSSPCFDGKHQMIMGGSFVSTGAEAEPFARFHFRPHFYQHAGFRMARHLDINAESSTVVLKNSEQTNSSNYETSELLSQYLILHYAKSEETFPYDLDVKSALAFPQRCANLVSEITKSHGIPQRRALDIGCAVGGASFCLSNDFLEVIGIDLSESFIANATEMKEKGQITFYKKDQGQLHSPLTVLRPHKSRVDRIQFRVGDASNLDSGLGSFDAVLMANLLCRLPDPEKCLQSMFGEHGFVNIGGLLVLLSPYSWMSEHTPQRLWLGGKTSGTGQRLESSAAITEILKDNFTLLLSQNVPALIREHERKFQYIVPHLMAWKRIR